MQKEQLQIIADDITPGSLLYNEFLERHIDLGHTVIGRLNYTTEFSQEVAFQKLDELIDITYSTGFEGAGSGVVVVASTVDGTLFWIYLGKKASINIYVSAETVDQHHAFMKQLKALLPQDTEEPDDDTIKMRFWNLGSHGPTNNIRNITSNHWEEVKRNYPQSNCDELEGLMDAGPPSSGGKLILWSGPPGGGKTNAIQALSHAWRDWCDVEYVIDPEAFFGSADYLIQVMNYQPPPNYNQFLGIDDEDGEPDMASRDRWRLVVVEDAAQFIRKEANESGSNAFGRLLNLTDGLIGQGMKIIVLVTTNEPMKQMHPALSRPGRCLANIKFEPFPAEEASKWLGREVKEPKMLADLYAQEGVEVIESKKKKSAPVGQYI